VVPFLKLSLIYQYRTQKLEHLKFPGTWRAQITKCIYFPRIIAEVGRDDSFLLIHLIDVTSVDIHRTLHVTWFVVLECGAPPFWLPIAVPRPLSFRLRSQKY
jgi:hypothetical protein